MTKYFVILPNQLFEFKNLPKNYNIYILWEHPHYFTKYNYNKKKLMLHRASMKCYFDYLKSKVKCLYLEFNENFNFKNYDLFNPVDKIELFGNYEFYENPNFLLTTKDYELYREKTDKFVFNNFYMWSKKHIDLMAGVKSMDKLNRNKLPKNIKIPKIPNNNFDLKYINEAKKYVEKYFKNNYGNTDNFMFPVSFTTAKKFLLNFINNKLCDFGPYQDSILENNNTLFHSLLSSSINIGLLMPLSVANKVIKSKKLKQSVEGFVRQLFWREYQRYTFMYCDFNGNYFGNRKKLTTEWYVGELGIKPVDNCIVTAFNTGYLHHIERLMMVGNFMNLYGINPKDGFRWFMEFSCDSYEWVMFQNVLDMVFFVTGGKTMTRPYLSSSNYILKMSDYKKSEKWTDTWDNLYKTFLKKNKQKLYKYRYYHKV